MITISPPRTQKTRVTIKNASNPFGKHIYQPFISESLYQNTTPSPQTKTNIYQENNNTIAAPISSRSRKCNPHKKLRHSRSEREGERRWREGQEPSHPIKSAMNTQREAPNPTTYFLIMSCFAWNIWRINMGEGCCVPFPGRPARDVTLSRK